MPEPPTLVNLLCRNLDDLRSPTPKGAVTSSARDTGQQPTVFELFRTYFSCQLTCFDRIGRGDNRHTATRLRERQLPLGFAAPAANAAGTPVATRPKASSLPSFVDSGKL